MKLPKNSWRGCAAKLCLLFLYNFNLSKLHHGRAWGPMLLVYGIALADLADLMMAWLEIRAWT